MNGKKHKTWKQCHTPGYNPVYLYLDLVDYATNGALTRGGDLADFLAGFAFILPLLAIPTIALITGFLGWW